MLTVTEQFGKVLGAQNITKGSLRHTVGRVKSILYLDNRVNRVFDTEVDHCIHTSCNTVFGENLRGREGRKEGRREGGKGEERGEKGRKRIGKGRRRGERGKEEEGRGREREGGKEGEGRRAEGRGQEGESRRERAGGRGRSK